MTPPRLLQIIQEGQALYQTMMSQGDDRNARARAIARRHPL
jgi:hypothetical protein